jgi:FkbM family methyltransferase
MLGGLWLEPVRRMLGALWYRLEPHLDHPLGRRVATAISRAAVAAQYSVRCEVRCEDGLWEYRWTDGVVVSDKPLIMRARPDEFDRNPATSPPETWLWGYQPVAGDVVVDVGSERGSSLHLLTRLVGPEGRVYAFEANPRSFRVLERVCGANGWQNVIPVHSAIASHTGTIEISDDDALEANDVFRLGGVTVECLTVDDYALAHGVGRIDLILMNIEGAEKLAIRGMERVAGLTRHMTISCHDFLGEPDKMTKSEVRDWLVQKGFLVREQPDPPNAPTSDCLYAFR